MVIVCLMIIRLLKFLTFRISVVLIVRCACTLARPFLHSSRPGNGAALSLSGSLALSFPIRLNGYVYDVV